MGVTVPSCNTTDHFLDQKEGEDPNNHPHSCHHTFQRVTVALVIVMSMAMGMIMSVAVFMSMIVGVSGVSVAVFRRAVSMTVTFGIVRVLFRCVVMFVVVHWMIPVMARLVSMRVFAFTVRLVGFLIRSMDMGMTSTMLVRVFLLVVMAMCMRVLMRVNGGAGRSGGMVVGSKRMREQVYEHVPKQTTHSKGKEDVQKTLVLRCIMDGNEEKDENGRCTD